MSAEPHPLEGDLIRAVELLAETFAAQSICYALVGGLAVGLRGRPRFTQDVDVLLEASQLALPRLLDALTLSGFHIERDKVIHEFVRENLTMFHFRSVRIDWLKPVLPLYTRTLSDASSLPWTEGRLIRVATAEGLILTKMAAFRPQDRLDIETLVMANCETLDVSLVRQEWSVVAAGEEDRTAWLEDLLNRFGKT